MPQDISISNLRANLPTIADRVERGESFRVIRRSKPIFVLKSIEIDNDESEDWVTVVDFTEDGEKRGMPAKDVLRLLQKIDKED